MKNWLYLYTYYTKREKHINTIYIEEVNCTIVIPTFYLMRFWWESNIISAKTYLFCCCRDSILFCNWSRETVLGGNIAPPSSELESLSDAESPILLPTSNMIDYKKLNMKKINFSTYFICSVPGEITVSSICTSDEDGNKMSYKWE